MWWPFKNRLMQQRRRAEEARRAVEEARARLTRARTEVVKPLKRADEHNQFMDIIRKSLRPGTDV